MMVVVEPHQQAIKLAGGRIVGPPGEQVHTSGLMWKLPWPLQTAAVYDVSRIRTMPLTAQRREDPRDPGFRLWSQEIETDEELDPFLVGGAAAAAADADAPSELFALVDAEISLRYRIRPDGLLDFLGFSSDEPRRRQRLNMREAALKSLALRTITQHLSTLSLDSVIAAGRARVVATLRGEVQAAFDRHQTGVEVVALSIPMLRPSGGVATEFEDLNIAKQQRRQAIAEAEGDVTRSLAVIVGDPARADEILGEIDTWRDLLRELGPDDTRVIEQRQVVEEMLTEAGGALGQQIDAAGARHWIKLLEIRGQARQFQGQLAAYRAAPRLFQQRQIMGALRRMLADRRKFVVVGIDPARINLDIDFQEAPSIFGFAPQGETEP